MKQFCHLESISDFWREVKRSRGIESGHFHATTLSDPALSTAVDRLAALVADGRKTATSHLLLDFDKNAVPARKVGDYWLILDSAGRPSCVVRVNRIEVRSFHAVDAETARAEGGGDLSLDYWREVHRAYFGKQCNCWGVPWSEDLPVVSEFFERQ
jgi:uncharacterized protein YhfF